MVMGQLGRAYLIAYNTIQALGWSLVLIKASKDAVQTHSILNTYHAVGHIVCLLQSASLLELLNSLIGLVDTGRLTTLMQWGGRSHIVLSVLRFPNVQTNPFTFVTFMAWSLAEVIRYPHYVLSILKICPQWLTWLRYTTFIVLYPVGVFGEVALMYKALFNIKRQTYYLFIIVLIILYPFLWWRLYQHMLRQRKKKLLKKNE